MNLQIRTLERQSGIDVYGLGKDRAKWESSLEKFAKLTVEDCIQVLINYGYTDAASALTEAHFGAEPAWQVYKFPEI
jgi:hypothetical protein